MTNPDDQWLVERAAILVDASLAAASGDRESAIHAYRRYLFLRTQPEPALRAEVAHARTELARLERGAIVP